MTNICIFESLKIAEKIISYIILSRYFTKSLILIFYLSGIMFLSYTTVFADKIYFSSVRNIHRSNLDGSNAVNLLTQKIDRPRGIAIDTDQNRIFWVDVGLGSPRIIKSNLDGSKQENVIYINGTQTSDVEYDSVNRKIYWTESTRIMRANQDGSNIEEIISTNTEIHVIKLFVQENYIYWTENAFQIQRARLDGSEIETVITTPLNTAWGMAIDTKSLKLYWLQDGTEPGMWRSNLDGSGIENVLIIEEKLFPSSICYSNGVLYYAYENGIYRIDPNDINSFSKVFVSDIYDFVVDSQNEMIYWTVYSNGNTAIIRAKIDGSNTEAIITPIVYTNTDIAVDLSSDKMYWTERILRKIMVSECDGSNPETLIDVVSEPWGLKIDNSENKIYWSDNRSKWRANLDGSNVEQVSNRGRFYFEMDVVSRYFYWTTSDGIVRENMDGSDLVTLIPGDMSNETRIAIDTFSGFIYWAEIVDEAIWLRKARLDGTEIEGVVDGIKFPLDLAIDTAHQKLYWIENYDFVKRQLFRSNTDGSDIEQINTPDSIFLYHLEIVLDGTGACCDKQAGICSNNTSKLDCQNRLNEFFLDQSCDSINCKPVLGACCDSATGLSGSCEDDVLYSNCTSNLSLTWSGSSNCDEIACEEQSGACCDLYSGDCLAYSFKSECSNEQQLWVEGATCFDVFCDISLGACCNTRVGNCDDFVTNSECLGQNQLWLNAQLCSSITCPDPFIPTLSQWGLMIMTLLIIILAKIYFNESLRNPQIDLD